MISIEVKCNFSTEGGKEIEGVRVLVNLSEVHKIVEGDEAGTSIIDYGNSNSLLVSHSYDDVISLIALTEEQKESREIAKAQQINSIVQRDTREFGKIAKFEKRLISESKKSLNKAPRELGQKVIDYPPILKSFLQEALGELEHQLGHEEEVRCSTILNENNMAIISLMFVKWLEKGETV